MGFEDGHGRKFGEVFSLEILRTGKTCCMGRAFVGSTHGLALCTTMRGVEIKNLHWRDVDFLRRSFTVRRSKTDAGLRSIPMNGDAYEAVLELWERAKAFEGTRPEHFLFPACEHGHIDPERSQKSWRTAWRKLTLAAGVKGFRFHDCRHRAITELAESQASDATIMALGRTCVSEDA